MHSLLANNDIIKCYSGVKNEEGEGDLKEKECPPGVKQCLKGEYGSIFHSLDGDIQIDDSKSQRKSKKSLKLHYKENQVVKFFL